MGTANPGFRWRSTLGYKYFAPNGAWAKRGSVRKEHSEIHGPGDCVQRPAIAPAAILYSPTTAAAIKRQ